MNHYDFSDGRYVPLVSAEEALQDLIQAGDKVTQDGAGYWVWSAARERAEEWLKAAEEVAQDDD